MIVVAEPPDMPLGIYHRVRTHCGTQFCPCCLEEDTRPYFRRSWRLGFVTMCSKHGHLLLERCPRCKHPVNFHRGEMGERNKVQADIACCYHCQSDCRKAVPPEQLPPEVGSFLAKFQGQLEDALRLGWTSFPEGSPKYAHLFFQGLRGILNLVCSNPRAKNLRWLLAERFPWNSCLPLDDRRHNFEHEPVLIRAKAIYWVGRLLEEWPRRFVSWTEGTAAGASALTGYHPHLPYWLHSIVRRHLFLGRSEIWQGAGAQRSYYHACMHSVWSNRMARLSAVHKEGRSSRVPNRDATESRCDED
jgi:hypothetical protein